MTLRHPAGEPGRVSARAGACALRRRSGRGGGGEGRADRRPRLSISSRCKYRPLETISNPEEALPNPEPRIHAYSELGNIHRLQAFEFGDVEEALKNADHVFEDLFFYEGNTHLPIEQHAAVAAVDGEGKLTLWSSTQVPHYVHRQLARVLQMPAAHIRVIACPNGGGFGGKCDICNHEMVGGQSGARCSAGR